MFTTGGRKMFYFVFVNFISFISELFQNCLKIDSIPNGDSVDDQIQTSRLIQLVFVITFANLPFIGDEQKVS